MSKKGCGPTIGCWERPTHLVEEETRPFGPNDFRKGSADLEFAARVTAYEVLHAVRGNDKLHGSLMLQVMGRTSSTHQVQLRGG